MPLPPPSPPSPLAQDMPHRDSNEGGREPGSPEAAEQPEAPAEQALLTETLQPSAPTGDQGTGAATPTVATAAASLDAESAAPPVRSAGIGADELDAAFGKHGSAPESSSGKPEALLDVDEEGVPPSSSHAVAVPEAEGPGAAPHESDDLLLLDDRWASQRPARELSLADFETLFNSSPFEDATLASLNDMDILRTLLVHGAPEAPDAAVVVGGGGGEQHPEDSAEEHLEDSGEKHPVQRAEKHPEDSGGEEHPEESNDSAGHVAFNAAATAAPEPPEPNDGGGSGAAADGVASAGDAKVEEHADAGTGPQGSPSGMLVELEQDEEVLPPAGEHEGPLVDLLPSPLISEAGSLASSSDRLETWAAGTPAVAVGSHTFGPRLQAVPEASWEAAHMNGEGRSKGRTLSAPLYDFGAVSGDAVAAGVGAGEAGMVDAAALPTPGPLVHGVDRGSHDGGLQIDEHYFSRTHSEGADWKVRSGVGEGGSCLRVLFITGPTTLSPALACSQS